MTPQPYEAPEPVPGDGIASDVSERASAGFVAGLGASAGALEALQRFVSLVPPGGGVAFVVVQHLERHHPSRLAELLSRHASVPVAEALNGVRVEADHVYVAPPDAQLRFENGHLRLSALPEEGPRAPIDTFLVSLAQELGGRAAAVILSGTGTDGTAGLVAVRRRGGLTIVQAPDTARHDGMPRSAIAAGADLVLPVEEIPPRVLAHARRIAAAVAREAGTQESELRETLPAVCSTLEKATGHDFSRYKAGTLLRRIRRRIQQTRSPSVAAYVRRLESVEGEAEALLQDLLISVTSFFRDPAVFDLLAAKVVPVICEGDPAVPVRVWVPGCATGEEAYSIAILLQEHLSRTGAHRAVQIFATDIDTEALAVARQGRYGEDIAEHVSADRLARFFSREPGGYQVARELREACIFSAHNLVRDPPFASLDFVSCRNVLIYLGTELQRRLVPLFHYALKPGGWLLLGPSEGLAVHQELFARADPTQRLLRRQEAAPLLPEPPLAVPDATGTPRAPDPSSPEPAAPLPQAFERVLLAEYAPACAVVNETGDVLYMAGPIGRHLAPAPGAPSSNLFDLLPEPLRAELRTALFRCARTRAPVVREELEPAGPQAHRLRMVVRPMPGMVPESGVFAVILKEHEPVAAPAGAPAEPEAERLRGELRLLRADLQTAVQDLEKSNGDLRAANEDLLTANEELQSANEELQTSNEELQTSKEELQSVNEELQTVNGELQLKVSELASANSDLVNLFAATRIATVFLDRELRLVRFTPAAGPLLHLIDADAGRPVTDLAPRLAGHDLAADAREVLRTLAPLERQVREAEGARRFVVRTLPYRTIEDAIAGVVVSFVDVTEMHRAEEQLRRNAELLHLSSDAVYVIGPDGRVESWNRGAQELYGYDDREAVGTVSRELLRSEFPDGWQAVQQKVRAEGRWQGDLRQRARDGRELVVSARMQLVRADDGAERVLVANRDITDRIRAEQEREHLVERLRQTAERADRARAQLEAAIRSMEDGVVVFDPSGAVVLVNEAEARICGYPSADDMKRDLAYFAQVFEISDLSGRALPVEQWPVSRVMRGESFTEVEHRGRRKDTGQEWSFSFSGAPARDEDGRLVLAVVITRDITERRRAVDALRETDERLRLAQQAARWGVFDHDYAAGRGWWSPELHALYGLAPGEFGGTPGSWLSHLHADDRARAERLWTRAAQTGDYSDDFRVVWPDGTVHWLHSRGKVFRDEAGPPRRMLGVSVDITERKAAEDALREADRRKNEFLGMLSHELRNPMTAIRNALWILERSEADRDRALWARQVIGRQVGHMNRLVDDLLDVTRITRGRIHLHREPLELAELVRRTVDDHRPSFAAAGVTLSLSAPERPVRVEGDSTRLSQVLGNLLHNATKFTERGGAASVRLETDEAAGEAVLLVKDTGVGIDASMLPRVFDAFSQAETSLERSRGGLGLGLALVRGLVEMHGGRVFVSSEGAGRGTEFSVRLPLERGPAVQRTPAETGPAAGRVAARRVLVVEDNADAALSLRSALALAGHEVEVAVDGPSGLARAREFRPDIVLCDIGLPGLDGYAVARALRTDPVYGAPYLVALTGYASADDRAKAKEAGFEIHLAKPASMEQVQQAIASAPPRR